MEEIIRYFYEECINKFVDLRMELYEHPETKETPLEGLMSIPF